MCCRNVSSYLEAPSQELVLHLQEVAFICLRFERLIDDGELGIVLDVLPPGVAVTDTGVKGHLILWVRDRLKQRRVGHHLFYPTS